MNAGVIIAMVGCTLVYAGAIVYFGVRKRKMWENLRDGDYVLCVRPDGSTMLEYVMAYRPEEERVCLSKEGWVSKFEFLCGKNDYYTESQH